MLTRRCNAFRNMVKTILWSISIKARRVRLANGGEWMLRKLSTSAKERCDTHHTVRVPFQLCLFYDSLFLSLPLVLAIHLYRARLSIHAETRASMSRKSSKSLCAEAFDVKAASCLVSITLHLYVHKYVHTSAVNKRQTEIISEAATSTAHSLGNRRQKALDNDPQKVYKFLWVSKRENDIFCVPNI